MLMIIVSYFAIAFCIFYTLKIVWTYVEPQTLQNWELIFLIFIALMWPAELIAFALFGPLLSISRFLRRNGAFISDMISLSNK